jgi:hypothetical protein
MVFNDSTIGSSDPNKNIARANKLDQEIVVLKIKLTSLESVSFSDDNIIINAINSKLFNLDPHQLQELDDDDETRDFINNW